ncbi:MAG: hypothetical protein HZC40_25180 [Chloroflexi bacterium]|nr:hypothetical protein [Chloroflexota bacterium]
MPIYEYECENCGTHFDKLQSIQSDPILQCPECSGSVHKVFTPTGIIFKGSGWYITDSRKAASSAVTGDASKKDSAESKPEKKPETKTEPSASTAASKT